MGPEFAMKEAAAPDKSKELNAPPLMWRKP